MLNVKPKYLLITAYLLNIFDAIISVFLFKTIGVEIELNPWGIYLYNNGILCLYKMSVTAIAMLIINKLVKKYPKLIWACWVVFVVYAVLTVWHVWGVTALWSAGAFRN